MLLWLVLSVYVRHDAFSWKKNGAVEHYRSRSTQLILGKDTEALYRVWAGPNVYLYAVTYHYFISWPLTSSHISSYHVHTLSLLICYLFYHSSWQHSLMRFTFSIAVMNGTFFSALLVSTLVWLRDAVKLNTINNIGSGQCILLPCLPSVVSLGAAIPGVGLFRGVAIKDVGLFRGQRYRTRGCLGGRDTGRGLFRGPRYRTRGGCGPKRSPLF